MAKKINLNGVKDFFFNHGEKVALGSCVFLALAFGVSGLMDAANAGRADSGKPWAQELKDKHDALERELRKTDVPQFSEKDLARLDANKYNWPVVHSDYVSLPYINVRESQDSKRQNPLVLAARSGPGNGQLDYVNGLVFMYEQSAAKSEVKILDLEGNAAGGNAGPQPGRGQRAGQRQNADDTPYLRAAEARRMIVGHMVFPMKAQVVEFQRAFKMNSQKELLEGNRDDLPFPLGFDLVKYELRPDGKPANEGGEWLVKWDSATRKPIVAEKLKKFLSQAMYDTRTPASLAPYIWDGLVMPVPALAYGDYPPVKLNGVESYIEEPEDAGGMQKKAPGGEGPKRKLLPGFGGGRKMQQKEPGMDKDKDDGPTYNIALLTRKKLKEKNDALDSRLFDLDFNVYHALGQKRPEEAMQPNGNQPNPRGPNQGTASDYFFAWDVKPGGKEGENAQPGGPAKRAPGTDPGKEGEFKNWDRDAVVRFIDVDVEPGKTYQYAIRVHMKNPNFGKRDLVAFSNLALEPELKLSQSPWAYTEARTIPGEYYLYALNQPQIEDGKAPAITGLGAKDATTFQIHKWQGIYVDQNRNTGMNYPIGGWAIAERVVVYKGDKIGVDGPGQQEVIVQAPYWSATKDRFVLSTEKHKGNKKRADKEKVGIIHMDLHPPMPQNPSALVADTGFPRLVDFTGGKRRYSASSPDEESTINALVLGADGKLRVFNARDAADMRDRQARLSIARQRFGEMRGSSDRKGPPTKGGPGLPGFSR